MMKSKSSNDCKFDADFSKFMKKNYHFVDCMTEGSYSIDSSFS